MNLTIATPALPVGITERRRYTYAGVVDMRLELQDGTRLKIVEQDGGIMVVALGVLNQLTLTLYAGHAVLISEVRYGAEETTEP